MSAELILILAGIEAILLVCLKANREYQRVLRERREGERRERSAEALARLVKDPIWQLHWGPPNERSTDGTESR